MTVVIEKLAGRGLTARELAILRRVALGWSDEEIGAYLFVSVNTVKTHVRRILAKLQARDRTHAVARGFETRLLPAPLSVPAVATLSAVRPLLSGVPRCPLHPPIGALPGQCWACRQWECAQGLVADVDALLRGGPDD